MGHACAPLDPGASGHPPGRQQGPTYTGTAHDSAMCVSARAASVQRLTVSAPAVRTCLATSFTACTANADGAYHTCAHPCFHVLCISSRLGLKAVASACFPMPAGRRQLAIRGYVAAVRHIVRKHGLPSASRDASLTQVTDLHRRLLRLVHPDKGGCKEDAQTVLGAMAVLQETLRSTTSEAGTAEPSAPPPAPHTTPAATPAARKRPAASISAVALASASTATASDTGMPKTAEPGPLALTVDLCWFCGETCAGPPREFRIQSQGSP